MSIVSNEPLRYAVLSLILASCGTRDHPVAPASVTLETEVVRTSAIPQTRITTGTVRSSTVSPLSAKVLGNVTRVLVSEGDRVRRGQTLVEIDSRDMQARLEQARAGSRGVDEAIASANAAVAAATANADFAAATLRRFTALRDRASVSAHEFEEVSAKATGAHSEMERARKMRDQLLAQRQQSRAAVAEAETFLSYGSVQSPIDGVVTVRAVDPGIQAAPGMPLVTVEDPASRRVETTVDEQLAATLRPGDEVFLGDTRARITNIATVDPATRSALVKIGLPHDSPLRSGEFVHVSFITGTRSALMVPRAAVATRGQLTMLYVIDAAGAARMRLVTLGELFDDRAEVITGLDRDERIVKRFESAREGLVVSGARS